MKTKAAQIYGYVVCVVAVITFLITIGGLINSLIDMCNPELSIYQSRSELSSFENFKVESMKSIQDNAAYIPDDDTLRKMYESAKEDLINRRKHEIRKNIIVNSFLLILSVIIFFVHWRWVVRT